MSKGITLECPYCNNLDFRFTVEPESKPRLVPKCTKCGSIHYRVAYQDSDFIGKQAERIAALNLKLLKQEEKHRLAQGAFRRVIEYFFRKTNIMNVLENDLGIEADEVKRKTEEVLCVF